MAGWEGINEFIAVAECGSFTGLEQAEQTVTQMQQTPQGKLKVTAPVTYGEQKIAPLLHQFLQQHEQLNLELVLTNQKLDLIEQGVDLAIRLGQLDDSSFRAKKLSNRLWRASYIV